MHYANTLLSGGKTSHFFESTSDSGQEKRAELSARMIEAGLQASREQDDPHKATDVARIQLGQFRSQLDPATISILQAELALAENNVTAAEQAASTAVELAPGSAGSHYMLGVVRYRAGDSSHARDAWLEAIQQNENFVPARLALAADAIRSGDASGAEQYVIPVVREEPANIRALCLYARILLAQQRPGAAGVIANRALAVNGSQAEPHIILGQIAFAQGNYAECLVQFERAMEKQHDSREALDGLIRVYRKGSITRSMLRRMEQIAMTSPRSAVLLELAGRMYAERGWYKDARRSLQQVWAIDPQRTTAAISLARLLGQLGETEAAEEWAKRAGGQTTALLSGFTAQQRNDTGTAAAQYEAALREGENTGVAANNLAWLYAQQGRKLDRALLLAEQARTLAPGNPAVLDTLGVVHLSRREYSQAIEVLKGAVVLTANESSADRKKLSADIRHHLSEAYLRSGLPIEASAVSRGDTGERLRPQGTD
jgi:tetratricopeptide (TPR) repeat protein